MALQKQSIYDPLAQTFIIDSSNYPNGIFLDSITLFFSPPPGITTTGTLRNSAGTIAPITLSITNTLNGYPNGDTLDYSIVTLNSDDVKISSTPFYLDNSTKTIFKFPAPIYIQPDVLYAIILRSASADYYPYIAVQGGTTIGSSSRSKITDTIPATGQKIGNVPYVGSLFESQNGISWIADPRKSLMMVIDRCVFNTSSKPIINFGVAKNNPLRKDISSLIDYNKNPDIVTNINGNYISTDIISDSYNFTTTDFVPSVLTKINYSYDSLLNNTKLYAGSKKISPGKLASPNLQNEELSDGQGPRVILANTSSSLILSAELSSIDDTISPIISDDGITVYNIKYKINNLPLTNSQIILVNGGFGYKNGTISSSNITVSSPDIAGGEQAILSATVASNTITSISVVYPGSGYLKTPTITITEPNDSANNPSAVVRTVSEFTPYGGNADCRYITKKVILTPQNESQDLRVFFTAYKPIGTNIFVFYKLLNSNDTETFENNSWQLMTLIGVNKNSVSLTTNDLYEFEAAPGTNGVADNFVSYLGTNGTTYYSFNTYAIKIVMTTNVVGSIKNDTTTIPFITELRTIALPSGTGF